MAFAAGVMPLKPVALSQLPDGHAPIPARFPADLLAGAGAETDTTLTWCLDLVLGPRTANCTLTRYLDGGPGTGTSTYGPDSSTDQEAIAGESIVRLGLPPPQCTS